VGTGRSDFYITINESNVTVTMNESARAHGGAIQPNMDPRGYFIIELIKKPLSEIDFETPRNALLFDPRDFDDPIKVRRSTQIIQAAIEELTNGRTINLTYMSPSDQPIASTTGLEVQKLCDFAMPYISEISHAMYLGRELQRARNCIDKGEPYEQA
jgi:hypothetical protein